MKRPELLVPAGDLEKLETALAYGADAVYAGGERFGLRAQAGNFSLPELKAARDLVRARGKRLYLTLNAFLRPGEEEDLAGFIEELRPLDLDAYIVADPGVFALVRRLDPQRPLHLSTQANTTSAEAARFWESLGVRRINLARELTLGEIAAIRAAVSTELEIFVHGAMCIAWSGRCLLSAALTGRSANRGSCTHPCRWRYALVEETRPGQWMPVEEDGRGTYIMNSRDLCLVEHLPALLAAGADSLKIEGRMKSRYYVAAVTRVYRAALDSYLEDAARWRCDPRWLAELDALSHRPYGTGFFFGTADQQVHPGDSRYRRTHTFVGVVENVLADGRGCVAGRNRFRPGEQLQLIGPGMRTEVFQTGEIVHAESGESLPAAQPNGRVLIGLPAGARPGDLLRREEEGSC